MPISIRDALPDDIPPILAIEQAAAMAAHWRPDQYESRRKDGVLIVAEQNGQLCGFLCARVVAGEWEIENVVVDGGFRRCGIGEALMEALLKKWESAAGHTILLEVRESNQAARALYEKCGLRAVGRRRGYYANPAEDAILHARYRNA